MRNHRTLSRFLFGMLLCGGMLSAVVAQADDRYGGVKMVRGTVFSIGRADPVGNVPAPTVPFDSGILLDANYTSVFLNGGAGFKDFNGHRVANLYAGFGFGRIFQIQAGYGDRGTLGRIRTDFNVREVYSFVTQQAQHRREKTLADRVTFTYTAERYSDAASKEFNNGTIGVGLLFEGPF